jgi:kynurenine formamidase
MCRRRRWTPLIRTAAVERLGGTPEYTNQYPGLDESAAEWLRERRVKAFGVDSPSPDNPISRTYPVHMMCRDAGITHFENLANLERLVGRRFTFIGFPLRIRAGTGSPVRAVAVLP